MGKLKSYVDVDINSNIDQFKEKVESVNRTVRSTSSGWSQVGVELEKILKLKTDTRRFYTVKNLYYVETLPLPYVNHFTGSIRNTTYHLNRWQNLTTLFTSIVASGGLFGISRMAVQAAQTRREASGVGLSYGQFTSLEVIGGRLGDLSETIEGVSESLRDVEKRAPLTALGVRSEGTDTNQAVRETLVKFRDLAKRTPKSLQGPLFEGMGLGQLGLTNQVAELLVSLSDDEFNKALAENLPNVDDATLKRWSDFNTQVDRAGATIETSLLNGFVNLTPGLIELSRTFEKLVVDVVTNRETGKLLTDFGDYLEKFGNWLDSDEAKKDVDKFATSIEQFLNLAINGQWDKLLEAPIRSFWQDVVGPAKERVRQRNQELSKDPIKAFTGEELARQKQLGIINADGTKGPNWYKYHSSLSDGKGISLGKHNYNGSFDPSKIIDDTAKAKEAFGETAFGKMKSVRGVIWHHTGGGDTVAGVENTFAQRRFPAQYVMDRDGSIHKYLPDGTIGHHILDTKNFASAKRHDLNNEDTIGIEVLAKNDRDVTEAQKQSGVAFSKYLAKRYGLTSSDFFGHGEVNPGHKQSDEGLTITDLSRYALKDPKDLHPNKSHEARVRLMNSHPNNNSITKSDVFVQDNTSSGDLNISKQEVYGPQAPQ